MRPAVPARRQEDAASLSPRRWAYSHVLLLVPLLLMLLQILLLKVNNAMLQAILRIRFALRLLQSLRARPRAHPLELLLLGIRIRGALVHVEVVVALAHGSPAELVAHRASRYIVIALTHLELVFLVFAYTDGFVCLRRF